MPTMPAEDVSVLDSSPKGPSNSRSFINDGSGAESPRLSRLQLPAMPGSGLSFTSQGQSFTSQGLGSGSTPNSPSRASKAKPRESALSASFAKLNTEDKSRGGSVEATPEPEIRHITQAEMVHTFEDHTRGLRALCVSPDSSTLYSGGEEKCIRVWSVGSAGFALRHTLNDAHSGWVWILLPDPNGKILYSGSGDRTIRMWDVEQPLETPKLGQILTGHEESVCSMAISADSAFLYSGSDDKTIRVWDVSAGLSAPPQLLQILTGHTGYVSCLALSQDGLTLFSGGMSDDTSIRMWRVCGLRSSQQQSSADGSATATAAAAKPPTCKLIRLMAAHTEGIYTLTLSPDGKLLYSGGEDKNILVWAVDGQAGTATVVRILEGAHDRWVRSLRVTLDGGTLISGSADTTIGLWDLQAAGAPQLLQVLRQHTDRVRAIRLSPDGRYLYSASSDRTIRCWKLK